MASRNRVEDQQIQRARKMTDEIVADIGTKALPLNPFARLKDVMNGYSLVKAAYLNKRMPEHAHVQSGNSVMANVVGVQRVIMSYKSEL